MPNPLFTLFSILTMLLISGSAHAIEYQLGHGALDLFDEEMTTTPAWVRYWMMFMGLSFIAGLLFVWKHPVARWVVGGMILSVIAGNLITPALGLTKLNGLISLLHIVFWSPALYLLLKQRPFMGKPSAYSIWAGLITAVILFSFIFDIRDAAIYLAHSLTRL